MAPIATNESGRNMTPDPVWGRC